MPWLAVRKVGMVSANGHVIDLLACKPDPYFGGWQLWWDGVEKRRIFAFLCAELLTWIHARGLY